MTIDPDDISEFRATNVLHCALCLEERPDDIPLGDWLRASFGYFHKEGHPGVFLQLWCDRHNCNITTIEIASGEWAHLDEIAEKGHVN